MSVFRSVFRASVPLMRPTGQQVRRLNLHEYQSMEIMKSYGVAIPNSLPAETPEDAEKAYLKLKAGKDGMCFNSSFSFLL